MSKINIEVIGNNAENVTGSCTRITTENHCYLIEFGYTQEGSTPKDVYNANLKLLQKSKCKKAEYVIITHNHADHCCLVPALFSRGFTGKIIVPYKSTSILKEMWLDSAYIMKRDCEFLNKTNKSTSYEPFYTEDDINLALSNIIEMKSDCIINLNEELQMRYTDAGHILLSKQLELFIKENNHTKKILFTGDLGNVMTEDSHVFTEKFKPITNSNIVFGECTYASPDRQLTKKQIKCDIDKIKTVIDQYCIDNKFQVFIPTFSLDRMPYFLYILWSIYHEDENFKTPILVDSPLANRLLDIYSNILEDDKKELLNKILSWKNVKRIVNPEDSKNEIAKLDSKIVLASSGMLCAGRSVNWAKSFLPNPNNIIVFCGYCGVNTLGWKIKNSKKFDKILIDGKSYKNNCQVIDLKSFSSHMTHKDLIDYYSNIQTEKIVLIHGNQNDKIVFAKELKEKCESKLKSTKIVCCTSDMKLSL